MPLVLQAFVAGKLTQALQLYTSAIRKAEAALDKVSVERPYITEGQHIESELCMTLSWLRRQTTSGT